MSLPTPRLDDRAFNDIVQEAKQLIPVYNKDWTDFNESDPGITLIELFAFMTDIILYRLNRVPDKHYVKFMELLGMSLQPPEPARAPITFWLTASQPENIVIKAGTEVATVRTETQPAVVFTTDEKAEIRVPNLIRVMTSRVMPNKRRSYELYDPDALKVESLSGQAFFNKNQPKADDALYLGFEENLSDHILGIELVLDTAEGAGIDPRYPPYVWETINPAIEGRWEAIEVDADDTLGLNRSGMVRLFLPKMHRDQRGDDATEGFWIRCRLTQIGEKVYKRTPMIRKLVANSMGITINATNVITVQNEVIGRSDGSPGQKFFLAHSPVMPSRLQGEHLIVRIEENGKIREEHWTEQTDFGDSGEEDRHYTIDNNSGELRSGPALRQRTGEMRRYGKILPKDAMLVMNSYRYGGGLAGNVAAGTISVCKTSIPYIGRVANRVPAKHGCDVEDIENAKLRVPGHLRSLKRAVTAADFEYLTYQMDKDKKRGEIARVHCLQAAGTTAGEVRVLVIPSVSQPQGYIAPESLRLPDELRDRILAELDERRLLSTRLVVSAPTYHWVKTEVRFRPSPHVNAEEARLAVRAKMFSFLSPLEGGGPDGKGWPFGRGLFISDIMAALLTVPGVNFIRSVRLFTATYEGNKFKESKEDVQEIAVLPDGMIASSYDHEVIAE